MNKDIPWRFIISHLKGDVDEKEEKLFCEWLQEERNTLLFRELESLWREIRRRLRPIRQILIIIGGKWKAGCCGRMKSRNLCHCGSFGWRYL